MGKIKDTLLKIGIIKNIFDRIEINKIKKLSDIERVEMLLNINENESDNPDLVPHIVSNMKNKDKAVDAFVEVAADLEPNIVHKGLEKLPLKKRVQILKKEDNVFENLLKGRKYSDIIKYIPQIADEDERYMRIYEIAEIVPNLVLRDILVNTNFKQYKDEDIAEIISRRIAKDCFDNGNSIHLKELFEIIQDNQIIENMLPLIKKHYKKYVENYTNHETKKQIRPFEEEVMEEAIDKAIIRIREEKEKDIQTKNYRYMQQLNDKNEEQDR